MSLNLQLSVAEGANEGRGREERKKSSYQGAGDKDSSAHFSSFMLCHLGQVTNPRVHPEYLRNVKNSSD